MRLGEWKAMRGITVLEAGVYPRGTVVVVDASIAAAYGYCVYINSSGVQVRYEHPFEDKLLDELAALKSGDLLDIMMEVMQVKDCYLKRWLWTSVQVSSQALAA